MGAEHSVAVLQRRQCCTAVLVAWIFYALRFFTHSSDSRQTRPSSGRRFASARVLDSNSVALCRTGEATLHMKIHLLLKKPRPSAILHRPAP